jgi:hypothetical protein
MVINNPALLLERSQTVQLIDAAGVTAALVKGCLWITMDGDRRDIMLGAGESWTVERNGLTLLHAEAPSTVRITEPVPATPDQGLRARLRRALESRIGYRYARAMVPYY